MTVPPITVDASGLRVHQQEPMTRSEARQLALRLLEAATTPERVLRRPAAVDDQLRERDG